MITEGEKKVLRFLLLSLLAVFAISNLVYQDSFFLVQSVALLIGATTVVGIIFFVIVLIKRCIEEGKEKLTSNEESMDMDDLEEAKEKSQIAKEKMKANLYGTVNSWYSINKYLRFIIIVIVGFLLLCAIASH